MITEKISQTKSYISRFGDKPFRPGQEEAIRFILESRKPVTVIQAPTGSGKSLIGMIAGHIIAQEHGSRFSYLAGSKNLQNQLIRDFPEAMEMRGRQNFPCLQHDHLHADQCVHSKKRPCLFKKECPYDLHKKAVARHPIQVLNYHYFLNEANFVGIFSDYRVMIIDEADQFEGALMDFIQLSVTRKDLDQLVLEPPEYRTTSTENGIANWRVWARDALLPRVLEEIRVLENGFEASHDIKVASILQHYKTLAIRAELLADYVDQSWILEVDIYEDRPYRWRFSPAWITPELAREYLFRHSQRVVFMSATFPTVTVLAKELGINPEDIDFLELVSTFPVDNRRIYLDPVADMRNGTIEHDMPKMLKRIQEILERHPREKGIIHAHSWHLTRAIIGMGDPRLVTHNTQDKEITLRRFKESPDPLVLVSPSSDRGVDLPDDQCRFLILGKAPFLPVKSKRVEKRRYETKNGLGKLWYVSDCAQSIVQATGRGVRHKDDRCTSYVLDTAACQLIIDHQRLFPRYWLEAVEIA